MRGGATPKMRWTSNCRGKDGPIWQMERFVWEDWSRNTRMERDQKERPKDLNKDFPDIHRYVAMARLDYHLLLGENHGMLKLNGFDAQHNPYGERRGSRSVANASRYTRN